MADDDQTNIENEGDEAQPEGGPDASDETPDPEAADEPAAESGDDDGDEADAGGEASEAVAADEVAADGDGGEAEEASEDALAALKAVQDAIKMAGGEADASPVTSDDESMAQAAVDSAADISAGADAAMRGLTDTPLQPGSAAESFTPPAFDAPVEHEVSQGIDLISDVQLNVEIELGRTRMLVEDVLKLADGSVVELDKLAGDPVDVFVNGCLVARGEVLVLNDNFCVRINEVIGNPAEAAKAAR